MRNPNNNLWRLCIFSMKVTKKLKGSLALKQNISISHKILYLFYLCLLFSHQVLSQRGCNQPLAIRTTPNYFEGYLKMEHQKCQQTSSKKLIYSGYNPFSSYYSQTSQEPHSILSGKGRKGDENNPENTQTFPGICVYAQPASVLCFFSRVGRCQISTERKAFLVLEFWHYYHFCFNDISQSAQKPNSFFSALTLHTKTALGLRFLFLFSFFFVFARYEQVSFNLSTILNCVTICFRSSVPDARLIVKFLRYIRPLLD